MEKKNLLMVLGPTEIEEDILALGAEPQEYMRTADYSKKLERIFKNLQYIFQTKNPVIFFASSGTGAMEASVTNVLSKNDTVLYINGGSFGERWGKICRLHGINTIELKVEFGESVNPYDVKNILLENKNIKAVFATLDETSSGALTDIESIGKIVKQHNETIFIVDAVSGLIVEPLQTDEWNIDIVVSSSQKAMAIPPGLGFMSISEKALSFAKTSNLRNFYFDIFDYISNWKRNQTPFTPAVSLLNQLDLRLEKIKTEGLEQYRKRYSIITNLIRKGLINLGFNVLAKHPANCVTGIFTEKYDASEIVRIMREKYHIEIAPSGGDLKTKLFRVGNFGAINQQDVDNFIKAMQKTIEELNNDRK